MLSALLRAFADLSEPALRRVVVLGVGIALASFAVLWTAVAAALGQSTLFDWRPLDWLIDLLGVLAVFGLSWLLFPAVVTIAIGFFVERIAGAVEARHYPGHTPARHASVAEAAVTTLRLMGLTIALNLLVLPVYLLAPGINFFVFLGLNGYLFGREYFEVVAWRRLEPVAVRGLRRRFSGRVFLGGVAIAGLFAVPLVNLAAPVIAIAFMLHLFEALPGLQPQPTPS
jgi:CysZ protein